MHFQENNFCIAIRRKILKIGKPKEIFSNVKEIKRLGLDVPVATELAVRLKLPAGILNAEDFINALSRK